MVKLGDDQVFSNTQEGANPHVSIYVINKADFHNDPIFLSLKVAHNKDSGSGLVSLVRGRTLECNSPFFSVYESFDKITGSQLASFGYIIHGIEDELFFKHSVSQNSVRDKNSPELTKNVLRKFWMRHKETPPMESDIEELFHGNTQYPLVEKENHDMLINFLCSQAKIDEKEAVILVVCCQEFMISTMKGMMLIAKNSMRESKSFIGYKKSVVIFDAYNPLVADSSIDGFEESIERHIRLSDQDEVKKKFDDYIKQHQSEKWIMRSVVLSEMIYHTKILNNALLFDEIDISHVILLANFPFVDSCKLDNITIKGTENKIYTDAKEIMDEVSPSLCMANFFKALLDPKDVLDQRYEYWESPLNIKKDFDKICQESNLDDIIREMIRHEQCCVAVQSLPGLRSVGSCLNTVVKKYASSHQIREDIRKTNVLGLGDVDKQSRLKNPHLNAFNEKVGQLYERGAFSSTLSLAERIAKVYVSPHIVSMHLDLMEIFSNEKETFDSRLCPKCLQLEEMQQPKVFCGCTYIPTVISKLNIDTKKDDQMHFGDILMTGIINSNFSIFGELEKPNGHSQERHGSANDTFDEEDDSFKNLIKKHPYNMFKAEIDSLDHSSKSELERIIKPKWKFEHDIHSRILHSLMKQKKINSLESQLSLLSNMCHTKQDASKFLDALMAGYNTVIKAYKTYIGHVTRMQNSKNLKQHSSMKINVNPLSYSSYGPIFTRTAECTLAYFCANSAYEFLAKSILPIKRQQKSGSGLDLDEIKNLCKRTTIPEEPFMACALKSSPIDNVSMKVGTFKCGKGAIASKQNDCINGRSAIRSATVKVKMLMPELNEFKRQKNESMIDRSARIDLNAISKMTFNSCQGSLENDPCTTEEESHLIQALSPHDIVSVHEELFRGIRYKYTGDPLNAFDDLEIMKKPVPLELMNFFSSFIKYEFDQGKDILKKKKILIAQKATLGEKIQVLKGTVLDSPDKLILVLRLACILGNREIPGGETATSVVDFLGYLFHLLVIDFIKMKDEYSDRKFLCPFAFEIKGAFSDVKRKMFPRPLNNLCPVLNLNKTNLATFRVSHFNFSAGAKDIHRTTLSSLSHQDISFMCSFTRCFEKSPYSTPSGSCTKNRDKMQILETINHSKIKFDFPNKMLMINSTMLSDIYLKHKTGQGRPKEQLESCISKRDEVVNYLDGLESIDENEIASRIITYVMSEHAEIKADVCDEVIFSLIEDSSISLLYEIEEKDISLLLEIIREEISKLQPMKKRKCDLKAN